MQESFNKIKKYFSKQKNFSKKPINPHKHWKIILSVFVISILCLIAFSLFLLIEIKNDNFFQVVKKENVNKDALNQVLFDKVMKDFDHKAQKIEELRTTPTFIPDPSL